MGFFLRKSFRLGPARLNLSKSGLGLSGGVKGARLGVTSRGKPYFFGGRHGLYVRESLGGSARAPGASQGGGGGPVVLYEDTDATYPASGPGALPEPRKARPPEVASPTPFVALSGIGLVLLLILSGPGSLLLGGTLVLVGAWQAMNRVRERQAVAHFRGTLSNMLRAGEWNPELKNQVRFLRYDGEDTDGWQQRELEFALLQACQLIATGEKVDDDSLELVRCLAQVGLGPASDFAREAKIDAYRGLVAILAADHELTPDDETQLERVREGLNLSEGDLDGELAFVEQVREVRRILTSDPVPIDSSVRLRRGENCYFEDEGRLLKERQLRSFQRDNVRYSVRGFVLDKEGALLLTDRRLLLKHAGTYEIRYREILDIEVSPDEAIVRITRDGRARPIFISTPDVLRFGAMLERLAEGG